MNYYDYGDDYPDYSNGDAYSEADFFGGAQMESEGTSNKDRINGVLGTSNYFPGQGNSGSKGKPKINGEHGTSPYFPGQGGNGNVPWYNPFQPITSPQLPYCPNYSMQSTGMGSCMVLQTPIPGIDACPSGTLGWYSKGQCVVW